MNEFEIDPEERAGMRHGGNVQARMPEQEPQSGYQENPSYSQYQNDYQTFDQGDPIQMEQNSMKVNQEFLDEAPMNDRRAKKEKGKKEKVKKVKIKKVKEPKVKKEKVKKEKGEGKGSVLLYAFGSIVIPYLFILFMGLMDQMAVVRVNVYVIVGISVVLFFIMIFMAIHCWKVKRNVAISKA